MNATTTMTIRERFNSVISWFDENGVDILTELSSKHNAVLVTILMVLTMSTLFVALDKSVVLEKTTDVDTTTSAQSTTTELVYTTTAEDMDSLVEAMQPATDSPLTLEDDPVEEVVAEVVEEETLEPITTTRLGVTVSTYDPNVDYSTEISETYGMIDDSLSNVDHVLALCEIYEAQRNLKIVDMGKDMSTTEVFTAAHSYAEIEEIRNPHTSYYTYTEDDLIQLARIVYAEAGASWCSDAHQRAVATVVMNRVTSSRFPNTIYDVLHAAGQYPNTCNNTVYTERTLENARYVLENGPTSEGIWQNTSKQGTTVLEIYSYEGHSTTYICK